MILDDFKIKFICVFDYTFFLHLLRELILTFLMGWQFALAFNIAWEWQDGLHNDGFNILDFLAGLIGMGIIIVLDI